MILVSKARIIKLYISVVVAKTRFVYYGKCHLTELGNLRPYKEETSFCEAIALALT